MSLFQSEFTTTIPAMRVRFGAGLRHRLAEEMDTLGLSRALILTTPQQADSGAELAATLGPRAVGLYSNATMHTPVAISDEATAQAIALRADCVVAIGGGSTTGGGIPPGFATAGTPGSLSDKFRAQLPAPSGPFGNASSPTNHVPPQRHGTSLPSTTARATGHAAVAQSAIPGPATRRHPRAPVPPSI